MRDYLLMHKNTPVLEFQMDPSDGRIHTILNQIAPDKAPFGLKDYKGIISRKSLIDWWEGRAIPASRSGFSRILMDLNISKSTKLLLMCYGLSLNDQYWIKEASSNLDWSKINFFENEFSEDMGRILFGEYINNADLKSPDNTSDGWLKKKWKIINGDRFLLKAGSGESLQEPLNEAIVSIINSRTGFENYVPYSIIWGEDDEPYSVCKNFITKDTELISAYYLKNSVKKKNNVSDYQHYLNCCSLNGIPEDVTTEFMQYMLTLDYIVLNEDRHYNNFGVIRDTKTFEIIGHAPVYDTGTSLWNGIALPFIGNSKYEESKPFKSKQEEQINILGISEYFSYKILEGIEDEFNDLLKKSVYITSDRRDRLVRCFRNRIDKIFGVRM